MKIALAFLLLSVTVTQAWDDNGRDNYQEYETLQSLGFEGQNYDIDILNTLDSLPLFMYDNYICKINQPTRPYYTYRTYWQLMQLRQKADQLFGQRNRSLSVEILTKFFNMTEIEGLKKLVESGLPAESALGSIMSSEIKAQGGDISSAVTAVIELLKLGQWRVLDAIDGFSSNQCRSLDDDGRNYLCTLIEPYDKTSRPTCGRQYVVRLLFDKCKCSSASVTSTPPSTATAAPPTVPTTPTPMTTAAPPTVPTTATPTTTAAPPRVPTTSAPAPPPAVPTTPKPVARTCGKSTINPAEKFAKISAVAAKTVSQAMSMLRIVGGTEAEDGEFPFIVLLRIMIGGKLYECGGSLISERHVLTATHCTTGRSLGDLSVLVGEHSKTDSTDHKTFAVSKIHTHPAYNGITYVNDIAILELSEPVDFATRKDAGVICLPDPGQKLSPDPTKCVVAGWGHLRFNTYGPTELNKVTLPTYRGESCRKAFPNAKVLPTNTKTQLCTGTTEGGKDSCSGDSGGPLMCAVGNSWVQFGVVSHGYKCAMPGDPGIYTTVSEFRDWIDGIVKT